MKKAIVCSDLHLLKKPAMWSGRADIQGDDSFALAQIIDLCIEHNAELYILGDIIDSATTLPRPLKLLQEAFAKLRSALPDNTIKFIQGQHAMSIKSYAEQAPWLSLIPGTEHIAGKQFDFLGTKTYAVDYFPPGFSAAALADMPEDTKILFLHGTADIAMPFSPHFSVQDIPPHIELIMAGDYHAPIEMSYHREGKETDGSLLYCGSTWMTSVSEYGPRSVFLVTEPTNEGLPQWERLQLKTRPIFKYSKLSDDASELAQIDESLPENVRKPLLLVDMPLEPDELTELAKTAHVYVMRDGRQVSEFSNVDVNTDDDMPSDAELLGKYVDPVAQKDEFDFTMDILTSSVEGAVGRLKERLGM